MSCTPKHKRLSFSDASEFIVRNARSQPDQAFEAPGVWVRLTEYAGSSRRYILIFPPTGGSTVLDRSFARLFCQAGFTSIIMEEWSGGQDYSLDLGIHQRHYEAAQAAVDRVLSDIRLRSSTQGQFLVGVLGTSVGAIHAATALQLHADVHAGFLITGGAPLAQVIARSDQKVLQDAFAERKKAFGISSEEEYIRLLNEKIFFDPTKLGRGFAGKSIGVLIGDKDTTVPTANQEVLADFLEAKTRLHLPHNHFVTIVRSWLTEKTKIQKFFEESLVDSTRP